jgi:DNA recombination-dependent growth factor C
MRGHIEAGKQGMPLAMTRADRVSFVLTPSLTSSASRRST